MLKLPKQKRYHVHLYPVVRVKVGNIPADSQAEAINKALHAKNWYQYFQTFGPADEDAELPECKVVYQEWAEEFTAYLVDEANDPEYEESLWWDQPQYGAPIVAISPHLIYLCYYRQFAIWLNRQTYYFEIYAPNSTGPLRAQFAKMSEAMCWIELQPMEK